MKKTTRPNRREKGFVLLVTAASMFLIIPTVGLAIDASFLYAVQAKLSAACDAAALAAARSLSKGLTLAAQEDAAKSRARAFFNANFPNGYLETSNKQVQITVAETAYRTRTVYVQSKVDANLFFMRIFGRDFVPIREAGKASRRDVNLMLVLDRSGSMQTTHSCEPMKAAAREFVSEFANGRDRLGLITFSTASKLAFRPNMNFKPTLDNTIANISCSGWTSSAQALWKAYRQLQNINEPGTLNLLVFFTDGQPTGITARFPVKKLYDTRYEIGRGWNALVNTAPSYCKDNDGDRYNRSANGRKRYSYPNVNPNWTPPNRIMGTMTGQQGGNFPNHGGTYGLYNENTGGTLHTGRDCTYERYNLNYFRRDIAYIPWRDKYGNRTTGYRSVSKFTSGPYRHKLRPDMPSTLGAVAKNAADNAAYRIRDDANLRPVIYAIGLGDPTNPSYAPDDVFMKRVANDPTSPSYNENQQTGLFVFAPDNTQLNQAFARVASEILRISQ